MLSANFPKTFHKGTYHYVNVIDPKQGKLGEPTQYDSFEGDGKHPRLDDVIFYL